MSIGWVFPPSNGGCDDGFNDAGIEVFTGARFDSLAREIIQNSLDAAIDDKTSVTVEFDFVTISREEFLGADSLLNAMKKCEAESKDEKGKVFFGNAIKQLQKAKIPCLKISDSGTTGLTGDYRKREGQWYAMTKARGASDKNSLTAGGSFGIGKNAPFVLSALRTVFYSTLYKDKNGPVYRALGKSILISHSLGDDEYTQAIGFYGHEKGCMPLERDIPKILRPAKQGCVVFIPGFVAEDQWRHKITATVVSNFFYAIGQGKLDVLIQDEHGEIETIDKEQLDVCFQKIIDLKIDLEKMERSYHYHKIITSPDSFHLDAELRQLGHCEIFVVVDEGLPKQVALLRKTGMLITDEQSGLKRWVGRADFAGVFICDNDKGNQLLREMENPQHNAFEPDRAIPDRRPQCKKALTELVTWVRDKVDKLTKSEDTETAPIDELSEFFPDKKDPEAIPGDEGERDIEGRSVYSPKPLKRSKAKGDRSKNDEDGDDGGGGEVDGDGNGGEGESDDGTNTGTGSGGSGSAKHTQSVEIKNVRVVADSLDGKKKTVYFTPMENGKIQVALGIMGDDGSTEKIVVRKIDKCAVRNGENNVPIHADKYKIEGGNIVLLDAEENERVSLEVNFNVSVTDSISFRAFRDKADRKK